MKPENRASLYLGIGLISAASLAWQIGLTRILSVSRWYHFAFMVVSLAMLGMGMSGTYLTVITGTLRAKNSHPLPLWAGLFSFSTAASYLLVNLLPFDSYRLALEPRQFLLLGIIYFALAIPFFFAGLCIGRAIATFPENVGMLYFSSLIGSGAGCLLILLILAPVPPESTVLFVGFLGLLTAASFSSDRPCPGYVVSLLSATLLIPFLVFPPNFLKIRISPYKTRAQALRFPDAKVLKSRWNAFSRVDVIESGLARFAPGMSYRYPGELPSQIGITIDGENLTAITRFTGKRKEIEFTDFLPGAAGYRLARGGRTLIIRPRGGLEVLSAIYQAMEFPRALPVGTPFINEITVVEDNPLIIKVISEDFSGFAGGIYRSADVKVEMEIGRAFLRRIGEKFDLIQLPLTDGFNATSAGAFSLHTNYLYTVEAVLDYLRALSPHGVLCLTRWLQVPPAESLKLAATIVTALELSGFRSPGEHLAVFRTWRTVTYLVKRKPLTDEEIELLRNFCRVRRFDLVYLPGITPAEVNRYQKFARPYLYQAFTRILDDRERAHFLKSYQYDIAPTSDDRPFFFHFFRWRQMPAVVRKFGKEFQPFGGGGYLVILCLLALSITLSAFLILLPLVLRRRMRSFPGQSAHRWCFLGYFFFIGIGYLFVEVALIHKFVLFLSHPTYSLAIVLASILTFSGLGSLTSAKIKSERPVWIFLALPGPGVFIYALILPHLFQQALGQVLAWRILISVLALAPLAFLMGFPFPVGIRAAGRVNPDLLPWLWGVNGCASVISAISGMMIAVAVGFSCVLMLAGLIYLAAFLTLSGIPSSCWKKPARK